MARPRCAACGSDLRKGQKLGFVDCYIVHHHCVHTPSNVWVVVQETAQMLERSAAHVRVLETEITELTASIVKHRRELERADHALLEEDRAHRMTAARLSASARAAEAREKDIWEEAVQLRARIASLERAPASSVAVDDTRVRRFMAGTIGIAIGRGVWGIAHYFVRKLDTVDPTVARFALLDLS